MCNPELNRLNEIMQEIADRHNANPRAKISIPSVPILSYVYRNHLPVETDTFNGITTSLANTTKGFFAHYHLPMPKSGAFANCNGRWCEYIYAATAWNTLAEINRKEDSQFYYVYVKLPNNNSESNSWKSLLIEPIRTIIDNFDRDRSNQLIAESGHDGFILYSSNPDSMILKYSKEEFEQLGIPYNLAESVNDLTENNIQMFDSMFNLLRNTVMPSENLVAFLSVKTTLRPDRRYQFVHEGDSTKATLMFIAARGADPGLAQMRVTRFLQNKVFAVSFSNISEPDLQIANIAMSACVSSPLMDPVWAVDKLYSCLTISEAISSIIEIISF